MEPIRVTARVALVLRAFLDDVAEARYGFELMQRTGLPSGTVYPILARLEAAGWLVSQWEDIDPVVEARPPRRVYLLSEKAVGAARVELARLSDQLRPPPLHPWVRPEGSSA